ncbi:hypothetical protein C4K17_3860 [Pseudomonas chlororaphis subsp. aurantiaca]|nr:hypothetical protein C4K17_3860 [Pseudomonas chlororaphis subsp. aurantiaca]
MRQGGALMPVALSVLGERLLDEGFQLRFFKQLDGKMPEAFR